MTASSTPRDGMLFPTPEACSAAKLIQGGQMECLDKLLVGGREDLSETVLKSVTLFYNMSSLSDFKQKYVNFIVVKILIFLLLT